MPREESQSVVARLVKVLRLRRGLTQEGLAFRSGLSISLVARVEQGRKLDLRLSTVDKLAAALGVSPAELLGGRPPRQVGKGQPSRSRP